MRCNASSIPYTSLPKVDFLIKRLATIADVCNMFLSEHTVIFRRSVRLHRVPLKYHRPYLFSKRLSLFSPLYRSKMFITLKLEYF